MHYSVAIQQECLYQHVGAGLHLVLEIVSLGEAQGVQIYI